MSASHNPACGLHATHVNASQPRVSIHCLRLELVNNGEGRSYQGRMHGEYSP